jgi:hypothetical protein
VPLVPLPNTHTQKKSTSQTAVLATFDKVNQLSFSILYVEGVWVSEVDFRDLSGDRSSVFLDASEGQETSPQHPWVPRGGGNLG